MSFHKPIGNFAPLFETSRNGGGSFERRFSRSKLLARIPPDIFRPNIWLPEFGGESLVRGFFPPNAGRDFLAKYFAARILWEIFGMETSVPEFRERFSAKKICRRNSASDLWHENIRRRIPREDFHEQRVARRILEKILAALIQAGEFRRGFLL